MGRQPFRQMKSDGTMQDAGASSGPPPGYKTIDMDANYDHSFHKSYGAFGVDGQSTGYTMNYFMQSNAWYAYPFVMPKDGTLASIELQVGTAGASGDEIAVAIYPSDANGDCSGQTAILRKTDVDVSTTGYKNITSISSPTVTGGDIYWFVCKATFSDFPGTCKLKTSIGGLPNLSGRVTGGAYSNTPFSGVSRWGTFSGDPPATFTSSGMQYKMGTPSNRFILFNLNYS